MLMADTAGSAEQATETPSALAMVQSEVEWMAGAAERAIDFMVVYSFQIVGAVVILIVGYLLSNWAGNAVLRLQERRNIDVTLRQFIASAVRLLVLVMFLIIAVGKLGISITPFVAAVGGLAVGISFALQGPVSNYGAGVVLILTRPFKVGDTIRVVDQSGIVKDVNLAHTILSTEDGEQIVIPNRHVVGEVLTNSWQYRVVEGEVGISYGDDPERAIALVRQVLEDDPDVAKDPAGQVGIQAFADSAVEIGYRYWVPTQSFYESQYRVNLAVWKAIQAAGITIPFPQRDVHLKQAGS